MYSSCTPYVVALPHKNVAFAQCWVCYHPYYRHLSNSHAKLVSIGCDSCLEMSVRGCSFGLENWRVVNHR